ncbi:MAG: HAD hydrolase family protein [Pirellulales bacterium]|nr:HAD hydrolase family protein [Pirellulales bacterium]
MTADVKNIEPICRSIELILSDVDGVMTDGLLVYDNQGIETKRFYVRDGIGIRLWQKAGHKFGIITLRSSQIVRSRAAELDIEIVRQGAGNKLATLQSILDETGITAERTCYIGDDLPDLPVIRKVGLGVAVADACVEVRQSAHFVTKTPGGHGAVRETVEMILKAQMRWEDLIQPYAM